MSACIIMAFQPHHTHDCRALAACGQPPACALQGIASSLNVVKNVLDSVGAKEFMARTNVSIQPVRGQAGRGRGCVGAPGAERVVG